MAAAAQAAVPAAAGEAAAAVPAQAIPAVHPQEATAAEAVHPPIAAAVATAAAEAEGDKLYPKTQKDEKDHNIVTRGSCGRHHIGRSPEYV